MTALLLGDASYDIPHLTHCCTQKADLMPFYGSLLLGSPERLGAGTGDTFVSTALQGNFVGTAFEGSHAQCSQVGAEGVILFGQFDKTWSAAILSRRC